ncbi:head GIN domain-containing protein [Desertivirga xinjiangensis]|uniref:head GIN domain-containing protein n=1 Tax=Desertivirga xinjiangensis TaxID=539206 RepID=UPI002109C066|nr:head GIN domain-containing protein [Pedobacter xinjiangensis]
MKALFYLSILGFLFVSCTKERLEANGNRTTEVRRPNDFRQVLSSGANNIRISYGPDYEVELRGSSNLLPHFKTEVFNGTLKLGYERVNVQDDDIEVYVTMPFINGATLSGSGKLNISGNFDYQENFDVRISGSGDIVVEDEFVARKVNVTVSGSGDADLSKVYSSSADVKISGSGDVWVNPTESLKVKISGSGNVYYFGNPVIDSNISGSGGVVKKN